MYEEYIFMNAACETKMRPTSMATSMESFLRKIYRVGSVDLIIGTSIYHHSSHCHLWPLVKLLKAIYRIAMVCRSSAIR